MVSCACVCRKWREITTSIVGSMRETGMITFPSSLKQGELVLKDFNIKSGANGSDKAIVKSFNVAITWNTLEIRFYWAGKGTTSIPICGTYGPLISVISVDPNFKPPSQSKTSLGLFIGITCAVVSVIVLLIFVVWKKGNLRCKKRKGIEGKSGSQTVHTASDLKLHVVKSSVKAYRGKECGLAIILCETQQVIATTGNSFFGFLKSPEFRFLV